MKTEIKEEMEEIDDSYSYKSENSHPQSGKRWSQEENLKFCLFMTFFQDIFTHKRYHLYDIKRQFISLAQPMYPIQFAVSLHDNDASMTSSTRHSLVARTMSFYDNDTMSKGSLYDVV